MSITIPKDSIKRREVVRLRKLGKTFTLIGQVLGISRKRACELYHKEMNGSLKKMTPERQVTD